MAAAPLLLKGIPRLRSLRLQQQSGSSVSGFLISAGRPSVCTAAELSQSLLQSQSQSLSHDDAFPRSAKDALQRSRMDSPDYRKWKNREAEILCDIEPIISLTKEILHSDRYMDGERLTAEHEKAVVEKLLAYHPHSEDKIGCGLDSIMMMGKHDDHHFEGIEGVYGLFRRCASLLGCLLGKRPLVYWYSL
ncbi:uncharacterized protein LOC122084619 isoform X2 [Macadamia integrifolia]|uniref:uncharacterized protein LOC122084619 isoform X2 n=1 Tax=Macadamia integrifolia TaxID=60698 RepID=UPI001C4E7C28|nr:uncharacterized protein LOC122084619 isoform X2 [Macadamia integrifolia]